MIRAEIEGEQSAASLWAYSVIAAFLPDDSERIHYENLSSEPVFESRAQATRDAVLHLLAVVERLGARMLKRPACHEERLFDLTVAYPQSDGDPIQLRVVPRDGSA